MVLIYKYDQKNHIPFSRKTPQRTRDNCFNGPRQVGKTYLMRLLENNLKTKEAKTIFFNLDVEHDKQFFTSQTALINYIRLQVGETQAFVFIDEIQRKKDAGLFLKGIYDMNLPYKFIVSGSGSLDLKARMKESLGKKTDI